MQLKAQPRLAVFGGSFNPVHEGHVGIVRALAADAGLSGVVVVPARRSPFKRATPLLPDALRWAMLRASLRDLDGVWLSDVELRRPAPSYTVDTLRTLAALLPATRLAFALGWDAFVDFAGWHRAPEVLGLAELLIFDRDGAAPPGRDDPDAWRERLPPPWKERARPLADGSLGDEAGRTLVRRLPMTLPAVAGRDILVTRDLTDVPAGARELLAGHWQRTEAP